MEMLRAQDANRDPAEFAGAKLQDAMSEWVRDRQSRLSEIASLQAGFTSIQPGYNIPPRVTMITLKVVDNKSLEAETAVSVASEECLGIYPNTKDMWDTLHKQAKDAPNCPAAVMATVTCGNLQVLAPILLDEWLRTPGFPRLATIFKGRDWVAKLNEPIG
jgi:hypothetical protein